MAVGVPTLQETQRTGERGVDEEGWSERDIPIEFDKSFYITTFLNCLAAAERLTLSLV
jgi:hypothetical protein